MKPLGISLVENEEGGNLGKYILWWHRNDDDDDDEGEDHNDDQGFACDEKCVMRYYIKLFFCFIIYILTYT